jgi:hypothetical protein
MEVNFSLYKAIKLGNVKVNHLSPAEHRFWARVSLRDGPVHRKHGRCWSWTGSTDQDGYGLLKIRGQRVRAHRFSYELNVGPVPTGYCVCHDCDNPNCVKPAHLFLDTQAGNLADMCEKGRQATGERNGAYTHPERRPRGDRNGSRLHPERLRRGEQVHFARLTEAKVRHIRQVYRRGHPRYGAAALALRFGVSIITIKDVAHRRTWKHVK